jgi:tetratricopeptide (TPR) repeat protein
MNDVVPLLKFTPSAQDPALLEAITVQREPLIASLVDAAADARGGARHWLLVGPRGMGKTHVLSLVVSRLRQRALRDQLVLAWTIEDPWSIRTYSKLLAELAGEVAVETDDAKLAAAARRLRQRGDRDAEVVLEEALKKAVGTRRLVVFMENLDEWFRRIGTDGQNKLRALAEDWRQLMIVATTPQLFAGIQRHQSPFYGFFNITHLDELKLDNAIALLRKVAEVRGQPRLAEFVGSPAARRRLAAVEALAGGHPRIWLLLAGCISVPAIDRLVPLFIEALDDLTPYYQDRLRELGDQQQELVVLLCEAGGALTNSQLAKGSGIAANQVASILRTLAGRGYVRRATLPDSLSTGDRRRTHWELREPLMRLCLDVKRSRGRPLQIVVEFLREWYGARLLDEMVGLSPDAELAKLYVSAAVREAETSFTNEDLLSGTAEQVLARAEVGLALLPDNLRLKVAKATGLAMAGRGDDLRQAVDELLEHGLKVPAARLSLIALLVTTVGPGDHLREYDARLREALDATESEPGDALLLLIQGTAHHQLGQLDHAIEKFERAVALQPGTADFEDSLGDALAEAGRDQAAVAAYRRAAAAAPRVARSWRKLLPRLEERKDFAEALEQLESVQNDHPNDPMAAFNIGYVHQRLGEHTEAAEWFKRAAALAPESPTPWFSYGVALIQMDRWKEAIPSLQRAIKLDGDNIDAHTLLVGALRRCDRYDEAIAVAERTIELDPARTEPLADVLNDRANELREERRFDDAERDARRAVKLLPGKLISLFTLVEVLLDVGSDEEGLATLDEALARWRESPEVVGGFGDLCRVLFRRFSERDRLVQEISERFLQVDALEHLGQGLVASLDYVIATDVDPAIAERWLAFWQDVDGQQGTDDLDIPLAIMSALIAWKRDGDEAHLLALPSEQRAIAVEIIGRRAAPRTAR